MAISSYRDFLLVAEVTQKDDQGVVSQFSVQVFDSLVGQGEKKELVAIPADLPGKVRKLEKRQLDSDVAGQIELGEVLAGLLLPPYARQMFSASLLRLREGEGLRLRLRLADELSDYPWEYLYIQDVRGEKTASSFLALDPRLSIVRDQPLSVPPDTFGAVQARRVLVAMASPEGYPPLSNLAKEQAALKEALAQAPALRVDYLPDYAAGGVQGVRGATLQTLADALTLAERTDIFHFSGHGEFTKRMGPAFGSTIGEGGIVLADAGNQALPLAADRLGELLRSQGVRLVVLGACETGRRDNYNVWSSVAASLLKARIPAVVAMQFTVRDDAAAAFSGALYRALVAGYPLDYAVAAGRVAMRNVTTSTERDWGVPVLYLRGGDGMVFNAVGERSAVEQAQQALARTELQFRKVEPDGRVVGAVVGEMSQGVVQVDVQVGERVEGVVIGGYAVNLRGGQLQVREKADTVSGVMIGAVIDNVGGGAPASGGSADLSRLRDLLRMDVPERKAQGSGGGRVCTQCGSLLPDDARFCGTCGKPVAAGGGFCKQCGAKLAADAKFCASCGAKV